MKILLTGANGFIGSFITAALLKAGHKVHAGVRKPEAMTAKVTAFQIDLNSAINPSDWQPHLSGIEAVINCAGILQASRKQDIWAIHHKSPVALFRAAEKAGIKKIIQISAISAEKEVGTDYALSKLGADETLQKMAVNWTILRPSLVIAPTAYGGTALMRTLSSVPLVIPVVGKGNQPFQPVTMADLCDIVVASLLSPRVKQKTVDVVGPEIFTIGQILIKFRRWLGKKDAPFFHYPMPLAKMSAAMGDFFGFGPLRTTSLKHMNYGNVSGPETVPFLENLLGRKLETLDDFLKANKPDFSGR
ncbi:MAG: complex I NDUFA9 subunit family protein [Sphingomonadales bacterium]